MSRMKEGEEEKTKSYTALIWTQKPIEREDITFIDDIKVSTGRVGQFQASKVKHKSDVSRFLTGSDSGSENSSEGFTPASSGRASESHPQHEHTLPGLPSLLPGAEDAGGDVSSRLSAVFSHMCRQEACEGVKLLLNRRQSFLDQHQGQTECSCPFKRGRILGGRPIRGEWGLEVEGKIKFNPIFLSITFAH